MQTISATNYACPSCGYTGLGIYKKYNDENGPFIIFECKCGHEGEIKNENI